METITVEIAKLLPGGLGQKINELAALGPNWDGENAKPVKAHVLADIAEALRRLNQESHIFREPFLAPTFEGSVQVEWNEDKRSLDIEAVQNGWSAVATEIMADGLRRYHTAEFGRNDFARFKCCYDWVLSKEELWPLP